jgi:hypothetical protein
MKYIQPYDFFVHLTVTSFDVLPTVRKNRTVDTNAQLSGNIGQLNAKPVTEESSVTAPVVRLNRTTDRYLKCMREGTA